MRSVGLNKGAQQAVDDAIPLLIPFGYDMNAVMNVMRECGNNEDDFAGKIAEIVENHLDGRVDQWHSSTKPVTRRPKPRSRAEQKQNDTAHPKGKAADIIIAAAKSQSSKNRDSESGIEPLVYKAEAGSDKNQVTKRYNYSDKLRPYNKPSVEIDQNSQTLNAPQMSLPENNALTPLEKIARDIIKPSGMSYIGALKGERSSYKSSTESIDQDIPRLENDLKKKSEPSAVATVTSPGVQHEITVKPRRWVDFVTNSGLEPEVDAPSADPKTIPDEPGNISAETPETIGPSKITDYYMSRKEQQEILENSTAVKVTTILTRRHQQNIRQPTSKVPGILEPPSIEPPSNEAQIGSQKRIPAMTFDRQQPRQQQYQAYPLQHQPAFGGFDRPIYRYQYAHLRQQWNAKTDRNTNQDPRASRQVDNNYSNEYRMFPIPNSSVQVPATPYSVYPPYNPVAYPTSYPTVSPNGAAPRFYSPAVSPNGAAPSYYSSGAYDGGDQNSYYGASNYAAYIDNNNSAGSYNNYQPALNDAAYHNGFLGGNDSSGSSQRFIYQRADKNLIFQTPQYQQTRTNNNCLNYSERNSGNFAQNNYSQDTPRYISPQCRDPAAAERVLRHDHQSRQ